MLQAGIVQSPGFDAGKSACWTEFVSFSQPTSNAGVRRYAPSTRTSRSLWIHQLRNGPDDPPKDGARTVVRRRAGVRPSAKRHQLPGQNAMPEGLRVSWVKKTRAPAARLWTTRHSTTTCRGLTPVAPVGGDVSQHVSATHSRYGLDNKIRTPTVRSDHRG